jgi:uncharacterized protein (TIGR00730 family)
MLKKIVSIFGTSKAMPGSAAYKTAYELGTELARAGFVIANGAYGGTMLAAAEAACKEKGRVIGVTCSAFARSGPNEYVSQEISTASLNERLNKLIELADGFAVLPGGTGTLLELAAVWELKNKGFLETGKPIILIGDFWQPLINLIKIEDPQSMDCIDIAENPAQAAVMLSSRLL